MGSDSLTAPIYPLYLQCFAGDPPVRGGLANSIRSKHGTARIVFYFQYVEDFERSALSSTIYS
jgi:hypothetical protein